MVEFGHWLPLSRRPASRKRVMGDIEWMCFFLCLLVCGGAGGAFEGISRFGCPAHV